MAGVIGVVVVGVGRAGNVRIRDIMQAQQQKHPSSLQLIGYVSKRELKIEGCSQMTLQEALSNPDVHVLIVCTENERHEEIASLGIKAGKHILVEFPLALSADKAKELYRSADEKGVVCYEEDIALLTEQHEYVKNLVKDKPKLTEGKSWIHGSFNGWIEHTDKSGSPYHTSISQIQRLLDIFGDVTPVQARISVSEGNLQADCTLKTPDGGLISIESKREKLEKPKRETGFVFRFEDGGLIDSKQINVPKNATAPPKPGLFMSDLIQFVEIVRGERDNSPLKKVTLRSLHIADQLHDLAKKNAESQL